MPQHSQRKHLPYSQAQLFALVADIQRYPEFLPWCTAARIRKREGPVVIADLAIGFKMVRERFTSRVTLREPDRIDVTYADGPFKYLRNHWVFEDDGQGGCVIDFHVDFEFRSKVLDKLIGAVFGEAVRRMVGAFEGRAAALYGPGGKAAAG